MKDMMSCSVTGAMRMIITSGSRRASLQSMRPLMPTGWRVACANVRWPLPLSNCEALITY